jgi:hypothetical protein
MWKAPPRNGVGEAPSETEPNQGNVEWGDEKPLRRIAFVFAILLVVAAVVFGVLLFLLAGFHFRGFALPEGFLKWFGALTATVFFYFGFLLRRLFPAQRPGVARQVISVTHAYIQNRLKRSPVIGHDADQRCAHPSDDLDEMKGVGALH